MGTAAGGGTALGCVAVPPGLPAGAGLDALPEPARAAFTRGTPDAVPLLLGVGVAKIGALVPAPGLVGVPVVPAAGDTLLEAVGFATGLAAPAPDPG